jgi:hypothetical protein
MVPRILQTTFLTVLEEMALSIMAELLGNNNEASIDGGLGTVFFCSGFPLPSSPSTDLNNN